MGPEHAPPEALHAQAEPEQAADPRHEQQQQPVHDEGDESERQHVERERDHAHDPADHAVHDAEDERDEQVRHDRLDVECDLGAAVRRDRHMRREDERRQPQRERVDEQAEEQSSHPAIIAAPRARA